MREPIYEYTHGGRHYAMLIVRDVPDLKDIIIPLVGPRLTAYKMRQFKEWFRGFSSSQANPRYQFLFNIYKDKFPEFYT